MRIQWPHTAVASARHFIFRVDEASGLIRVYARKRQRLSCSTVHDRQQDRGQEGTLSR
jgi:hypothetical protein